MISDSRLELLGQLTKVTEAQILAARKFESQELQRLTEQRQDLLFALRVEVQNGIPESGPLRDALATEAKRLRKAEVRLNRIASVVVNAINHLDQRNSTPTYGRSGRISM